MSAPAERPITILILFLVMILVSTGVVRAAGRSEEEQRERQARADALIEEARVLIGEKYYSLALSKLAESMSLDPDRRERAEGLIRIVRQARAAFNERLEDLILLMDRIEDADNPDAEANQAAAFVIVTELEGMERSPAGYAGIAELLRHARREITSRYYKNLLTRIERRGQENLDALLHREAALAFIEGYAIGRVDFDRLQPLEASNLADGLRSDIVSKVDALRTGVAAFVAGGEERALRAVLGALEAGNAEALAAARSSYAASLGPLLDALRITLPARQALQVAIERTYPVFADAREDFFMKAAPEIADWLAELFYSVADQHLGALSESAGRIVLETYRQAVDRFLGSDWQGAETSLRTAAALAFESSLVVALFSPALRFGESFAVPHRAAELAARYAPRFGDYSAVARSADLYADTMVPVASELEGLLSAGVSDVPLLRGRRSRAALLSRRVEEARSSWQSSRARAEAMPLSDDVRSILAKTTETLDDLAGELVRRDVMLASRMADVEFAPLAIRLEAARAAFDQADGRFRGQDDGTGFVRRFPREALAGLQNLAPVFDAVESDALGFRSRYQAEPPGVLADSLIRARLAQSSELLRTIGELRTASQSIVRDAGSMIRQAAALASEFSQLMQEGERAIRAANPSPERAASFLQRAVAAHQRSLQLQWDEPFDRDASQRQRRLSEEITRVAKDISTAEIIVLLENASRSMSDGLYDQALAAYNEAEAKNAFVNNELLRSDIERGMRTAIEAKNSVDTRVVREIDPKYSIFRQNMNFAWEDYRRARELFNAGRRDESFLGLLDSAEQKVRLVQNTFLGNQEANVMILRITQLRDPGRFPEVFRGQYELARASVLSTSGQVDLWAAYNQLIALREIDPRFPGISDVLREAEFRLGIRIRPPSAAQVAQSNAIIRDVSAVIANRASSEALLRQADLRLQEARRLNPQDPRSAILSVQIADRLGNLPVLVLRSDDMRQYQRAVNFFGTGNYVEALVIVERLLQTPDGARFLPLQDLKRRIEARL